MRTLAVVMLCALCFACSAEPTAIERFCVFMGSDGYGSGVVLGGGYIVTAKHVLYNGDTLSKLTLLFPDIQDSAYTVVDTIGDLALVYSKGFKDFQRVKFDSVGLGDELSWVQPLYAEEDGVKLYFRKGYVTRDGEAFMVDKDVHPGASGTGVWKNGKLVGIAFLSVRYATGASFMQCYPIPEKWRVRK